MNTNKTMPPKVRKQFQTALKRTRKQSGYTQETMAEVLHLSTREYGDLERGKHGLSAYTMLLFLLTLADEAILNLLHDCYEKLER